MRTKRCRKCGRTLDEGAFYWNRVKPGKMGLSHWCKECTRAYMNGRYVGKGMPVGSEVEMKGHVFVKVSERQWRMKWTQGMIDTLMRRKEEGWSYARISAEIGVSKTACREFYLTLTIGNLVKS